MVEYTLSLDSIFGSLADPTRRDILRRLSDQELSVSEIAEPYSLSFAAVSKHLKILEKAQLIIKRRVGKQQLAHLSPVALKDATEYLQFYQRFMDERYNDLETYINKEER
jgi:DNA-binding transcriptional ArsR family regulator